MDDQPQNLQPPSDGNPDLTQERANAREQLRAKLVHCLESVPKNERKLELFPLQEKSALWMNEDKPADIILYWPEIHRMTFVVDQPQSEVTPTADWDSLSNLSIAGFVELKSDQDDLAAAVGLIAQRMIVLCKPLSSCCTLFGIAAAPSGPTGGIYYLVHRKASPNICDINEFGTSAHPIETLAPFLKHLLISGVPASFTQRLEALDTILTLPKLRLQQLSFKNDDAEDTPYAGTLNLIRYTKDGEEKSNILETLHRSVAQRIIVKFRRTPSWSSFNALENENKILERIKEVPNVTKVVRFERYGNNQFLFLKHAGFVLSLRQCKLGLQQKVEVLDQLYGAIMGIHALGVFHGDIKPANVCVHGEDKLVTTLIDFEHANKISEFSAKRLMNQLLNPGIGAPIETSFTELYRPISSHNNPTPMLAWDWESYFYLAICLLSGSLPWRTTKIPMGSPYADVPQWIMKEKISFMNEFLSTNDDDDDPFGSKSPHPIFKKMVLSKDSFCSVFMKAFFQYFRQLYGRGSITEYTKCGADIEFKFDFQLWRESPKDGNDDSTNHSI